jgi:hypothetical protein
MASYFQQRAQMPELKDILTDLDIPAYMVPPDPDDSDSPWQIHVGILVLLVNGFISLALANSSVISIRKSN